MLRITLTIALLGLVLAGCARAGDKESARPTPFTPTVPLTAAPLNLAGRWGGGVNVTEYSDAPRCRWAADLTLDLQQNGEQVTGMATVVFRSAAAVVPGAVCELFPPEVARLSGSIRNNLVEIDAAGQTGTGRFSGGANNEALTGTYVRGERNQGYRGCFETRRNGNLGPASCTP